VGLGISLVVLTVFFWGCSTLLVPKQKRAGVEKSPDLKLITDINTSEDSESINVFVTGDSPLTYAAVKRPAPSFGLVLYFSETALDTSRTFYDVDSDIVASIKASEFTDKAPTSRIEISLKRDALYKVTRNDTRLKISFAKGAKVLSSARLQDVKQKSSGKPGVRLDEKSVYAATRSKSAEVKPTGSDEDAPTIQKTEAFSAKRSKSISTDEKKKIHVKPPRASARGFPERKQAIFIKLPLTPPSRAGLAGSRPVKQTTPAIVNRIDFSAEDDGRSTIIIGTTRPVKYEIEKPNEKMLQLKLFNTETPDYRKQSLVTTGYRSAVDRIIPAQTPAMKGSSVVAIELRERVPYHVQQTDNLVMIRFGPCSMPSKPVEQVKVASLKKVKIPKKPDSHDQLFEFLNNWKTAWQNTAGKQGDIETYMSFYSDNFLSKGLDKNGWKKDKKIKNSRRPWIRGKLMDIRISDPTEDNRIQVDFQLEYKSSNYSEVLHKTFILDKEKAGWKIIKERTRLATS